MYSQKKKKEVDIYLPQKSFKMKFFLVRLQISHYIRQILCGKAKLGSRHHQTVLKLAYVFNLVFGHNLLNATHGENDVGIGILQQQAMDFTAILQIDF